MINSFTGDYRFLSNFATSVIQYNGHLYPSSEHAFQAAKAATPEEEKWVREAASCGEAKKRGNQVRLRPDWEDVKLYTMEEIVYQKFATNKDLAERLLATGEQDLVEGNTWNDTFWGVCRGQGHNHLGKILMRTRNRLRVAGMHPDVKG